MNIDGHLNVFDRDGTIVWSWRLAEELGRASGYGGRTSTPLVDEDQLLLGIIGSGWGNLGGPPRHRYFGFDKLTGEVRWSSTPGGNVADMNTQSVGVVGVVNGQRLWIDGNADGHIYALNARTGRRVWEFQLSKRGINVSPVLAGDTVYAAHSEENIDSGLMGRVVAIDATGSGDVTATHERWRADELAVGFSSPLLHDGRLYVIDNSANLFAIDAATGAVAWDHSVGTVGKHRRCGPTASCSSPRPTATSASSSRAPTGRESSTTTSCRSRTAATPRSTARSRWATGGST